MQPRPVVVVVEFSLPLMATLHVGVVVDESLCDTKYQPGLQLTTLHVPTAAPASSWQPLVALGRLQLMPQPPQLAAWLS